jgi:steroid 5-alpha reductase family enzyme
MSDKQKADFKARFPKQYCNVGLYRWVRCPNYLGEITFWVGNWVMGILFYNSPLKWIASSVGLVCIVLIMMGSTKRLENAQDKRYGNQTEYQKYILTVPVLFPFIPVYSLKKVRVFLE